MPDNVQQVARLLFLHAQTGLHPGSGTALGTVDLPVQRERHTQWPTIPGSALKGILRDACREKAKAEHGGSRKEANEKDAALVAAFGPGQVDENTSHAGALSLTDARILAFPVRSLRGVFAWVTCAAVLERLNRDLKLNADLARSHPLALPAAPGKDKALALKGGPLLVGDEHLVLEEFDFACTGDASGVAGWIAQRTVEDMATAERIKTHLAVLHDDDFTHFVRHATEVVARIGLDYERKTVKSGALFYQEFLPAETLFYSVVFATASRFEKHKQSAPEMMAYLAGHLPRNTVLQIGGDETTGKGLCAVRFPNGKEQ
jgi:CRISPR-associated protein Cmr4